jgi:hypothetical protein
MGKGFAVLSASTSCPVASHSRVVEYASHKKERSPYHALRTFMRLAFTLTRAFPRGATTGSDLRKPAPVRNKRFSLQMTTHAFVFVFHPLWPQVSVQ